MALFMTRRTSQNFRKIGRQTFWNLQRCHRRFTPHACRLGEVSALANGPHAPPSCRLARTWSQGRVLKPPARRPSRGTEQHRKAITGAVRAGRKQNCRYPQALLGARKTP